MRRRHRKQQVYAFIDSQNLNVSVQRGGWKIDWKKFRQFLADKYGVVNAYMFIGYVPEYENLYEQMHTAGYMVVLKPTFDMTKPRPETDSKSDQEEKHVKGNIDADLVLWAMKEMKNYSKAIIVSGDGDFYSLVEYLEQEKKLLKILTPGSHYSKLYNRYEEYIARLDHHQKELAYFERNRHGRRPPNKTSANAG